MFTFETVDLYDYFIADCSGENIVISKGTKTWFWQEHPFLLKDQFIIMAKNNGIWFSEIPAIQRQISGNRMISFEFTDAVNNIDINTDTGVVTIANLQAVIYESSINRVLSSTSTVTLNGNYDYAVADVSGANLVISKGTHTVSAQEPPSNHRRVIISRNGDVWSSPISTIQCIIDKLVKPQTTTTEIYVKAGGIPGVNCNYDNIKDALDAIINNSYYNQYLLRIADGDYDVSDDGNLFLGIKNYVNLVGQSWNTRIIKRESVGSMAKAGFDTAYYAQEINYASLRNLTVITSNCKSPIHADSEYLNGTLEFIDVNMINESTNNCLALGLRQNQRVVCHNVRANGMLWAHNIQENYVTEGCHFELYNCISGSIQVGDVINYGKDVCIIEGCKADNLTFLYYKDYPTADDAHLRSTRSPSWNIHMRGNDIKYINANTTVDGGITVTPTAMDDLYGGKWSIIDPHIHNYCKNEGGTTIAKGSLVQTNPATVFGGVAGWSTGAVLYGVSLDTIAVGDYGIVQYAGYITISADATTAAINYKDAIEIDSAGKAVKHTTGIIVGYAESGLSSGVATIKLRLT